VPVVSRLVQLPLDLLPEPGPPPPGSRLTRPRPRAFVGRVSDMQRLASALVESRTVAVVGEPGVGASAMVAEFAHRYGRYFAAGVFWLECSVPEAIPFQVAACGHSMRLRSDFASLTLDEQLREVLGAWQGDTPRLLIFDGVEGPIREWLPARGGAAVVATGRPPDGFAQLHLGPLPREHALALLGDGDPAALGPIAHDLGDLPLALRLAAGTLGRGLEPPAYRGRLAAMTAPSEPDQRRFPLFRRRSEPAPGLRQPVAAAFAVALAELGADAQAALAAAARLAPQPFPPELLGDAGVELLGAGLLEEEESWWRLHPRLGQLARGLPGEVERALAAWASRAGAEERLRILPHLLVAGVAGSADLEAALGTCLWQLGDGASARPHLERALEARERALGLEAPASIASLVELGALLRSQGDLVGARRYLEEAIRRGRGPSQVGELLRATEELGWTLQGLGETEAARNCLERVAQALAPDGASGAQARHRLGLLLREQGDLTSARSTLELALAGLEAAAGADDPRTLACLTDLGLVRQAQGDLAGAAACLARALELAERTLGAEHPDAATLHEHLGTALQARGDMEGARPHLERALAIREDAFGTDHPVTAQSLSDLGQLLRASGDLEGARQLLERALVISQRVLGPYDPQTATSLSQLGTLLQAQGELVEAQPYLERAVAIREQALGADHPETGAGLHDLGALLVQQGDLIGARTYLERALEIREQALAPDHPDLATTRHLLGTLVWQLGDPGSALVYLERAVSVRERVLGPDHPDTLDSIRNLDALRAGLPAQSVGLGDGVGDPDPDEGPTNGSW
jgi:tetratricopeptide (TPR) repeat protein